MTDATDLQYSIPPQKPLKVLIVGCGISGLTTALGLKLSGHGVTIFEQASTLTEVGAGIQLAPSASRILRRLGVLVEAEEKYYAPLAVIHRGDLLDILVRKVKGLGVSILLNARVEAIDPEFEARIQIHPKDNPITSDLIQQNIGMRWMGPGGHIMAYPIKRNTFYNMVLVHPQTVSGERKDEAWTRVGSEHQMQHIYQGWNEVIQMLLFLVPEQEIVKRSLHTHSPLSHWFQNKCVLAGDACHPVWPYVAQGAAQAVEDAAALTLCLSLTQDIPTAFREYELHRKDRAERIQHSATATREVLHLPDGEAQRQRDAALSGHTDNPAEGDTTKMSDNNRDTSFVV
ncbi:FAD-dependent oxidoreductase [Aspergillus alliaceus]|uniref:FAD-dependent oxidoreductase n=1 Tax=Petromyces alliaceus TaxID=209559 RepID=UPI0012A4FF13|nr:uncharacterized protein BDW43DRAFT_302971 [Aspergillus alliaceus]KAB8229700.1 hypothetical protein BDW43DRAFT_302971 [Aspergillus alliaceus]